MGEGTEKGPSRSGSTQGTPWYAAIQAEALRKVEAEWAAKQAPQQAQGSKVSPSGGRKHLGALDHHHEPRLSA